LDGLIDGWMDSWVDDWMGFNKKMASSVEKM
jgi:hypothetical protein